MRKKTQFDQLVVYVFLLSFEFLKNVFSVSFKFFLQKLLPYLSQCSSYKISCGKLGFRRFRKLIKMELMISTLISREKTSSRNPIFLSLFQISISKILWKEKMVPRKCSNFLALVVSHPIIKLKMNSRRNWRDMNKLN